MLIKAVDAFPEVWKRTGYHICLAEFFGYNEFTNRDDTTLHIIYET